MAKNRMDVLELLRKQAQGADLDFLREGLLVLVQAVMEAEVEAMTGAERGERSPERITHRNGYRDRPWDTRVGTLDLRIPKVREGSYFPSLLEPRRRSERALLAVVQQAYVEGVSTRRVEDLIQALGCDGISKSQVSRMCSELDTVVESFLGRPLDGGPYPYVWLDVLTQKVREGGRIVNVSVAVATAVNREGKREVLGIDIGASEDGAFWLSFLRSLVARGLNGVQLVTSDVHQGLKDAIATAFRGASWQRCRTHFMTNLLSKVPRRRSRGWRPWFERSISSRRRKRCMPSTRASWGCWMSASPKQLSCWRMPGRTSWPLRPSPWPIGNRSGRTTRRSDSTRRSGAGPTSWASSRTALRSAGLSEPSWPNSTTSGRSPAGISPGPPRSCPQTKGTRVPYRRLMA